MAKDNLTLEKVEDLFKKYHTILTSTQFGPKSYKQAPKLEFLGTSKFNQEEIPQYALTLKYSKEERTKAREELLGIAKNENLNEEIREKAYKLAGIQSKKARMDLENAKIKILEKMVIAKTITRKIYVPQKEDSYNCDENFTPMEEFVKYEHNYSKKQRRHAKEDLNKILVDTKEISTRKKIENILENADIIDKEIRNKKIINAIGWGIGLTAAYFLARDCVGKVG